MKNIKDQCGICETAIWAQDGLRRKKTDEYHEVEVVLSTGSKMRVGVCSKHVKPSVKQLPRITTKLYQGWQEEVDMGIGNADWVANMGNRLAVAGVVR